MPEKNPFLGSFEINCGYSKPNKSNSEDHLSSITFNLMEYDRRVSVYQDDLMQVVTKFSGSTHLLFFYVLAHLGDGSESIQLLENKVTFECGISKSTFRRSLEQLKELNILRRKRMKNMYWINPGMFFRGQRYKNFPNSIYYQSKEPSTPRLEDFKL
jgi:Firmicute plasmid replication protein (RepL)